MKNRGDKGFLKQDKGFLKHSCGHNKKIGGWGERVAARFLIQKGYEILAQNYFIRGGELDIVAWGPATKTFAKHVSAQQYNRSLCFIEVKTRAVPNFVNYFEGAERATGPVKQRRMMLAARRFCAEREIDVSEVTIRFEQLSVYLINNMIARIKHYDISS